MIILEAAGAVLKITSSLKPNHHREIQLAQIPETLCILRIDPYHYCQVFDHINYNLKLVQLSHFV